MAANVKPQSAPAVKSAAPATEEVTKRAPKGSGELVTVRLATKDWNQIVALSDAWAKETGFRIAPHALVSKAIAAFLASKPSAPKVTF